MRLTRGTLTHFSGSRLAALFSGQWDDKLPRDRRGRIFLDLPPHCFKKLVNWIVLAKDSPAPKALRVDRDDEHAMLQRLYFLGLADVASPLPRPC